MHIDKNTMEKFHAGAMDTEEITAFLEHLDHCDFCLEEMLTQEECQPAAVAPLYLKEQILAKAASPEIQAGKAITATSKKMQLLYWSLRSAAGVAASLVLLFGIFTQVDFNSFPNEKTFHFREAQPPKPSSLRENYLDDISRDINSGISHGCYKVSDYLKRITNTIKNGGKEND